MKYKKTIILLALVVFLLSIAGVSASEMDNTIASENANTIELSTDNDIIEDNLQTSEENMVFTSTDYDEAIAQTDTEILGADSATYTDLIEEIGQPGNIKLTHKNYTYYGGETITIREANKVIDGNGAVIDMNGSTIRAFHISASGVTIKNLTIKNANYNGNGGAIYFDRTGTVTNCNFTNNTATYYGGAVYFYEGTGTVTNCNFVDNKATGDYSDGGAVYFYEGTGTVTNCNFTNNTAKMGNAIYINNKCTISDCDFTNNPITKGAIHSVTGDITLSNNIINVDDVVSDKNFTEIQKLIDRANDGDEITINGLYAGFGIPIRITKSLTLNGQNNTTLDAKKLSKILYITANNVIIKNIQFTSGYAENGGAIYFSSTGTVTNCNFTDNDAYYGGAVYFSSVGNVTNCNFTNNTATYYGGAVFFYDEGTVSNCNFTNNTVTYYGGAVFFNREGSVSNCNFTNNTASGDGGAINMGSGTVTNCNFVDNKATGDYGRGGAVYLDSNGEVTDCNFTKNSAALEGGAVYLDSNGEVTNCNFADNSAIRGGAIYSFQWSTTADTCIFKTSSDSTNVNTVIYPPTLNVNNFTTVYGSGEKLTFDLKTNSSIPVTNGNISISVYFKDNGDWVRNYTCLSGEGWIPDLPVGSYIAFFYTEYAEFQKINRTITITAPEHTFWFLDYTINGNDNPVIELPHDFYFDPAYDAAFVNGIVINRPVTIKGNGNAIDAKRQARIFHVQSANAVLENLTLKNAHSNSEGGAVYFSGTGNVTNCNFTGNTASRGGAVYFFNTGNVTNCNFTENSATEDGGAVFFIGGGEVTNCNFTDNTAGDWGGAIMFVKTGTVSNCNFTGNNATTGSAIYFIKLDSPDTLTVSDSTFLNNRANAEALDIVKTENNITITFTGQNNLLNAIYSPDEVTFNNVKYWGATGITTVSATISGSNKAVGQNITVGVVVNDKLVLNDVIITNETGTIVLDIIAGENYYISARHDADSYYTEAEKTISNNINVNVTSKTTTNKTVNITAKSNIYSEVMPGKLLFILPNGTQIDAIYGANGTWWAEHTFDDCGEYNVNATYVGLDNVTVNNGTITINKVNSTIALDNIVLDYGESANVTVTTTGATGITANINGTDVTVINNYTIPISGLGAGNYILTVTTIADDNHNPVTKEVTITVNKVSTEITLANETLDLKVNDEFAVLADLTPAGAGNLTYSSSNESVVKVSDEGLITALSEGTSIVTVSFAGNDNYTVAQNKTINVTVSLNDASVSAEDITLDIGANATIGAVSVPEGLKVTYIPDNSGVVTVENGVVTAVKGGTAKITLKVGGDGIYAENSTTITVTVNKINATVDVLIPENVTVGDNSTVNVVLPEDATGNVTVKVDGEVVDTVPVKDGSADVTIPSMSAGNHTVNVSYSGDDNYKSSSKTATLSVAKDSTNLTAANVTATYNINKYLVITLKDSKGNPLANSTVTVDLNGAKNYTTDENGQVKVKVSNLVPKTYSAKITFDGNGNYLGSDATAKVVVKKATPKITANAKTFKTTTKTKKYTITLNDNTGKAIKNAKVYLKVNGKTYKATTNSKGKATFKITKLDKKGTFKATITYKGSKYYNKVTKKANIKVISTWKTISKGSKLKSTVKEIQRALKNNGYYLTAYGHYLMVDGIYWDHTVNAVKQFQKAKGLKVTGKVDEKTAKKLGII